MDSPGPGGPGESHPYNWPGVLNFLQHEYRRHELERTEQMFEIATLKVNATPVIGFLGALARRCLLFASKRRLPCSQPAPLTHATAQARVQTLERERALQEQHKLDLLKRVKMLEYALIQERCARRR